MLSEPLAHRAGNLLSGLMLPSSSHYEGSQEGIQPRSRLGARQELSRSGESRKAAQRSKMTRELRVAIRYRQSQPQCFSEAMIFGPASAFLAVRTPATTPNYEP
jgi:hypothetical protein